MKIVVIGGGPAGLYFARLMKRRDPRHDILVIEQNPSDATYGFGVTLGGPARERMKAADPELHSRLAEVMLFNNKQRICLDNEGILVEYSASGGAIARLQLLQILQESCLALGITLQHDRRVENLDEFEGFDLIVGADGTNSVVRNSHPDRFQTRSYVLKNRFVWYGVRKRLYPNALVFRHALNGVFVAHYYGYRHDMSTFVAECDGPTWADSGFDRMSDAERKATIEKMFARELDGELLVENKSIWRTFSGVVNDSWSHRNMVLIGDALRSAHFSIGSGTRLAMEDALALFEAFGEYGEDIEAAFAQYFKVRKPVRELFGEATERSFNWYENVRAAMRTEVWEFAHDFLTRTGRVNDERLKEYAPQFYIDYMRRRKEPAVQALHK